MSEDDPLPLELRELEARLASCSPAPARLERDRLMYEAGRATAGTAATVATREGVSAVCGWRRATFALAACVVVSASLTIHAYTTRPRVLQQVVHARQMEAAPVRETVADEAPPRADRHVAAAQQANQQGGLPIPRVKRDELAGVPDQPSYLYQRNLVLRDGVDALPLSQSSAVDFAPAPTVRDLLEELMPPNSFARPHLAPEI